MRATRWQELEPLDPTHTSYHTHETFTGLLEPLIMWLYRRDIEAGFIDMSQALKKRAESSSPL